MSTGALGDEYERKVTARWIGGILRRKLRLPTERRHGCYVSPREAFPQIARLTERYGLESDPPPETTPDPLGDFG
jgi:hypothetical protein